MSGFTSYTKISNVIGVPVPQWVINQFNGRALQNTQSNRSAENLKFLANKTAWVRMVSSVNIGFGDMLYFQKYVPNESQQVGPFSIANTDSLAKNFILFAGTSKYSKDGGSSFSHQLRAGLGQSYGMLGEEEINRYGYVPMPGITSVNIDTAGRLGSVRTATVNFKVYDKLQLDIVDALYFKLGYTMLLEWGNTYYYETPNQIELTNFENYSRDSGLVLKSSEDYMIDPFAPNMTKEKINYKIAEGVNRSFGNYDGMLGVVTNFNFTRKEDSSYDCVVKIIGLGALAESIKINRANFFVDVLTTELKKIIEDENDKIRIKREEEDSVVREKQKENQKRTEQLIKQLEETPEFEQLVKRKVLGNDEATEDDIAQVDLTPYRYFPSEYSATRDIRDIESDIVFDASVGDSRANAQKQFWAIPRLSVILDRLPKTKIKSATLSDRIKLIINDSQVLNSSQDPLNYTDPDTDKSNLFLSYEGVHDTPTGKESNKYPITIEIGFSETGQNKIENATKKISTIDAITADQEQIKQVSPKTFNSITPKIKSDIKQQVLKNLADLQGEKISTENLKNLSDIFKVVSLSDYTETRSVVDRLFERVGDRVLQHMASTDFYRINGKRPFLELRIKPDVRISNPFTSVQLSQDRTNASYVDSDPKKTIDALYSGMNSRDVVLTVYIADSSLIKNIEVETETVSRELLAKRNVEELRQSVKSNEEFVKQRQDIQEANKEIDVSKAQKEEAAKYFSSLELILKSIQIHSLNRTGESTEDVQKVNLIEDDSEFGKKLLGTVGLYSTMYEDLIVRGSNSIDDIEEYANFFTQKKTNEVINASEEQLLKFYAKYGFSNALMAGLTPPREDMIFEHSELLEAYVIPKNVSQTLMQGIVLERPVYIKLGTLLMLLNHVSLIYDSKDEKNKNRTPLLYIDYNPRTNFCLSSPNHLSTNPIQFLIPYAGQKEQYEKLFMDQAIIDSLNPPDGTGIFDPQNDDTISKQLPPFIELDSSKENAYRGKIMNVLVDVQYLLDTLRRFSVTDGTNSTYLKSFLEAVLSDFTKSTGNYNILRLAYNDAANCLYIVDDQLTPGLEEEKHYRSTPTNRTEIPLYGKTSLAKTLEIKTDISSRLSSMIAISANSPSNQGTLSTDSTSFGFINRNFTDRYIPLRDDISSETGDGGASTTKGDTDAANHFNDAVKSFYGIEKQIMLDYVGSATSYYIARMAKVKSQTPASRASVMIPVSINFSTDGISGFNMYQSFSVSEELLPYTYAVKNGTEGVQKVGFCVVGLSHTIESNQWTTSARSQMVFLKDETDYDEVETTRRKVTPATNSQIAAVAASQANAEMSVSSWQQIAFDLITKREGYLEVPQIDAGTLRGGYGTDRILINNVLQRVTASTRFTRQIAKDTLIREIETTYSARVIRRIGQNRWNLLNNKQKAALTSYAYNVGFGEKSSFSNKIVDAINSNASAQIVSRLIAEGPITSEGKVIQGLIDRRKEEAALYIS